MENKKDLNKKDSEESDRDGEGPASKGGVVLIAVLAGVFILVMVINMC